MNAKARTFSAYSHVVAMLFGQLTHANKVRDAAMAAKRFWGVLDNLRAVQLWAVGSIPDSQGHPKPATLGRAEGLVSGWLG